MKKIMLVLACGLSAYTSASSALPLFSRQTGMACVACHQQHFPVLSDFGRAFKAAGYATVGTQTKIESDRLSIPANLNAAILVKLRYQSDNTPDVGGKSTGTPNSLGDGQLQFGDEFGLYLGGRVAENIGFLFEGNTLATGGSLLSSFKLPISYDLPASVETASLKSAWETGSTKLSVIPFTTDIQGVQYGYELSSGGVLRANHWAEHRPETSAVQYNAAQGIDRGAATGFSLVIQNDLGYINLTKWAPSFAMGGNNGSHPSYDMGSNYLRIAFTPTLGDWSLVTGGGVMGGSSLTTNPNIVPPAIFPDPPAKVVDTRQTFLDLQAHGKIKGQDMGIYIQYASAPATASSNAYNNGVNTRKAFTIGADYSMIQNILSIGAAYRNAQNGKPSDYGDNALTLTAVYALAQNVALHLNHSHYSGSAHEVSGVQKYLTTFMLEAAW